MLALYLSLAFLGLAAIDPIGIGIMPVLLIQKHPYKRVFVFLSGSFVSLMIMGLLFAKGLGQIVLHFENRNHWFIPSVEIIAATTLLIVAIVVYTQLRAGNASVEPSARTRKWLMLDNRHLFILGALLVAIQSVLDVVFLVAMVRVGQFQLSNLTLVAAVATYCVAALVLQFAVVVAFRFAPPQHKDKTLRRVHALLVRYSYQALVVVSLSLSVLLFVLAI